MVYWKRPSLDVILQHTAGLVGEPDVAPQWIKPQGYLSQWTFQDNSWATDRHLGTDSAGIRWQVEMEWLLNCWFSPEHQINSTFWTQWNKSIINFTVWGSYLFLWADVSSVWVTDLKQTFNPLDSKSFSGVTFRMELILIYSKASSTHAYPYRRDFPFLKKEWVSLNIAQLQTSRLHNHWIIL